MGLKLDQVVPWGRSCSEYVRMFALSEDDRACKILDCGGGPASFNVEMTQQNGSVISCDPLYEFSTEEIQQQIQTTYPKILQGVAAEQHCYVWQELGSPERMGQIRMAAMQAFLADFELGRLQHRYRSEALPDLPFADRQFDLALCSHLLFTYSDHLSLQFHLDSIVEMTRVAAAVRIFPLLTVSGELSPFVQSVVEHFSAAGYATQIKRVPYEFQRGGNQMLQVSRDVIYSCS
ncbi:MAG TPA: SAM-dependent methyltransferase [Thermosynechococcaceae cyanobacterium]